MCTISTLPTILSLLASGYILCIYYGGGRGEKREHWVTTCMPREPVLYLGFTGQATEPLFYLSGPGLSFGCSFAGCPVFSTLNFCLYFDHAQLCSGHKGPYGILAVEPDWVSHV